jgi:hypothetical protein
MTVFEVDASVATAVWLTLTLRHFMPRRMRLSIPSPDKCDPSPKSDGVDGSGHPIK